MASRPRRLTALDLVEGLQLGHAVAALHDLGVLASLRRPGTTVEEVAGRLRLDPGLLRGMLAYAAARSSLVRAHGGRFRASPRYSSDARYLLDLYGLAFGDNATRAAALLRRPPRTRPRVDRARQARAFAAADGRAHPLTALILRLRLSHVLDLGCGPATMLSDLARRNRRFVGWGLERHSAMRELARRNLLAAGAGKRVRIFAGDARRLGRWLPRATARKVRVVAASQLANEFFGGGPSRLERWLRELSRVLPNRLLLIADYYGRLGTSEGPREVLLHDYAQLMSGQGLPPPDLAGWNATYSAAGCRLAYALEDRRTTLFVHILKLPSMSRARLE